MKEATYIRLERIASIGRITKSLGHHASGANRRNKATTIAVEWIINGWRNCADGWWQSFLSPEPGDSRSIGWAGWRHLCPLAQSDRMAMLELGSRARQ
jgi:hypothetical protein